MRDSASGGALTEVTFYILLALCEPRHGYAVMQFAADAPAAGWSWAPARSTARWARWKSAAGYAPAAAARGAANT